MPNCSTFDGVPLVNPREEKMRPNLGYQVHWHVPIDDRSHWKYTVLYRYDDPIDCDFMQGTLFRDVMGSYHSPRNANNRYLQNRAEMASENFAGLGRNFYDHDLMVTESQGEIMDRSEEHLGTTDRPVMLMRKQMLQAINDMRKGGAPLFAANPAALKDMVVRSDMLPASTDLFTDWWRQPEAHT
ncbi:MAG: hypothetical protein EXR39_00300 [Betaproteobacteria bacterium]|nr:hypothetical protein [Betaproteobacteria bacterium]